MPVHVIGVTGLVVMFLIATVRPVNLGVLALVLTFLIGTFVVRESPKEMYSGFPVDLFVLLVGVTYLFGIAVKNGTVDWIVDVSVRRARARRAVVPWVVFALAAAPAMAGALGSSGVALLAPLAMRVAERCDIDRRLMGLMVVHGAAAGNFSPLNALGAIVHQAMASRGLAYSEWTLFTANLVGNIVLAAAISVIFRGRTPAALVSIDAPADVGRQPLRPDQLSTIAALALVAVGAIGFGLSIGFLALTAGIILQVAFPASSQGAEGLIAWGVVLLVCGVVTYVSALQRYGTVSEVGQRIAAIGSPLAVALLICAVGAVTSAFASSAGILGAMFPLAAPLMAQGAIGTTGLVTALALSATFVDATPFSTVGALAVASAREQERAHVYRGMLAWGLAMVVIAPLATWLIFVVPGS